MAELDPAPWVLGPNESGFGLRQDRPGIVDGWRFEPRPGYAQGVFDYPALTAPVAARLTAERSDHGT